jgi:uncharacterized repeat protein (TIGR03803 family)
LDLGGTLYGQATEGGGCSVQSNGCGVLFKIGNTGTFTVLHTFEGATDGALPLGQPILGADGNIYNVTFGGGDGTDASCCGTIVKYAP